MLISFYYSHYCARSIKLWCFPLKLPRARQLFPLPFVSKLNYNFPLFASYYLSSLCWNRKQKRETCFPPFSFWTGKLQQLCVGIILMGMLATRAQIRKILIAGEKLASELYGIFVRLTAWVKELSCKLEDFKPRSLGTAQSSHQQHGKSLILLSNSPPWSIYSMLRKILIPPPQQFCIH